jgi:hypothetical protein
MSTHLQLLERRGVLDCPNQAASLASDSALAVPVHAYLYVE